MYIKTEDLAKCLIVESCANSSKGPIKEIGGILDQEHPMLNNTVILAKQLKRATSLNRPYTK